CAASAFRPTFFASSTPAPPSAWSSAGSPITPDSARLGEELVEPLAGIAPHALHGAVGFPDRFRGLFHAQTGEEPEHDDLMKPIIVGLELGESLIERQPIDGLIRRGQIDLLDIEPLARAAALGGVLGAGALDENAAHGERGGAVEV